jgi:flagellar motor switch/type III secretory pathway protein FliN
MAELNPEKVREADAASEPHESVPAGNPEETCETSADEATTEGALPNGPTGKPLTYQNMDEGISLLPPYSRSLLRVRVPVSVTLAATTQPVDRVLDLCPGSIIQFDKTCDDPLTLKVGGQPVAVGEAVKVGDKFGLWITAMAMPEERFWVVNGKDGYSRVK